MEFLIVGLKDLTHPAGANGFDYSVVRNRFFRDGFHGWRKIETASLIENDYTKKSLDEIELPATLHLTCRTYRTY